MRGIEPRFQRPQRCVLTIRRHGQFETRGFASDGEPNTLHQARKQIYYCIGKQRYNLQVLILLLGYIETQLPSIPSAVISPITTAASIPIPASVAAPATTSIPTPTTVTPS